MTKKNEVTLNHGERMDDNWTVGTAACDGVEYKFNVKHYDEPSEYGIKGGRVSKLWLAPKGGDFRHTILNYDRGWERGFSPRGKGEAVAPSSRRSSRNSTENQPPKTQETTTMATRFTAREKAQLQTRFAEHSPKVWAHGDVATVHIFGGHYCIKKRESGCDWRWADANPCNDLGPLTLNRIATLAEL